MLNNNPLPNSYIQWFLHFSQKETSITTHPCHKLIIKAPIIREGVHQSTGLAIRAPAPATGFGTAVPASAESAAPAAGPIGVPGPGTREPGHAAATPAHGAPGIHQRAALAAPSKPPAPVTRRLPLPPARGAAKKPPTSGNSLVPSLGTPGGRARGFRNRWRSPRGSRSRGSGSGGARGWGGARGAGRRRGPRCRVRCPLRGSRRRCGPWKRKLRWTRRPSAGMEGEERATALLEWLGGLIGSHLCVAAISAGCTSVGERAPIACFFLLHHCRQASRARGGERLIWLTSINEMIFRAR